MFYPVTRFDFKSKKVYKDYIPMGYPITKRKKKYLYDLLVGTDLVNISFLDKIDCLFMFIVRNIYRTKLEKTGSKSSILKQRVEIIYSKKNELKYTFLKIEENILDIVIEIKILEKINETKLFNYVIDRNLKLEENFIQKEDPFEIPYFVSLIESSFAKHIGYSYPDIWIRNGFLNKHNETKYEYFAEVAEEYKSLEEFVVNVMK